MQGQIYLIRPLQVYTKSKISSMEQTFFKYSVPLRYLPSSDFFHCLKNNKTEKHPCQKKTLPS